MDKMWNCWLKNAPQPDHYKHRLWPPTLSHLLHMDDIWLTSSCMLRVSGTLTFPLLSIRAIIQDDTTKLKEYIWKMEPRDERIPRVAGNWWWGTPGSIMGGQTPAWHVRSPKWGSDKYQKILPADGKGCTQRKYQHTSHGRTSASSEHQSNGGIYHTRPSSSSRPLATYCIYIYLYIQNIDAPHFLLLWKPCHPLCQTQQGSLQSN